MSKVAEYLTSRVTAMLDQGIVPWKKPWVNKGIKPMSITGHAYRGINLFLFSMLNHDVPVYITFNQLKKMGGKIKEGKEQAYLPVYFYAFIDKLDDAGKKSKFPIFKYFNVWNIEDVENVKLPASIQKQLDNANTISVDPIAAADAIIAGYKDAPVIKHGGDRACYSPTTDIVKLPEPSQFHSMAEYYMTTFHELAHSTGHSKRLNRTELTEMAMFGDHAYSREELVAEMTAALLAMETGINNDSMIENSVSYIAGWASKLKAEPNLLATAASRAQKALDHIMGVTFKVEETAA